MWVARRASYAPHPSSSFTPASIPGLVAWYDASQISGQADNTALSSWPDLSGNGYNLSQATGVNQPTYYSSTAGKTVNGKPAVWFDGTDDYMQESTSLTLQPASFFAVVKMTTSGAAQAIIGSEGNGPAEWRLNANKLDLLRQNVQDLGSSTGTVTDGSLAFVATTWSGTAIVFYINSATADSTVSVTASMSGGVIELASNTHQAEWANGAFCEIAIYNNVVSSAAITQWHSYASAKWGTP